MNPNTLMIAAAGAGKTTFLANEALRQTSEVLITTYTEANEEEIKRKILQLNKTIPPNITVQTWFSFLIQHGVKPYQGCLTTERINGMCFVNRQSGVRTISNGRPIFYSEDGQFDRYYFNTDRKIYSDKLSKLVFRCNEKSNGNVIDRVSRIYPHIYVDEVQDLAGYDLEILKLLFAESCTLLLVGDPRQVTYLTHQDKRFSQYKDGKIEQFIEKECSGLNCTIDKETLKKSHRNNAEICAFSSRLYPDFPASESCTCIECRQTNSSHTGIFVVKPHLISRYVETCQPVILRYKEAIGSEWNFGKAKGLGFDHILIYPTDTFITYLHNGRLTKTVGGKTKPAFDIAKYYVALTRARYSVGIVYDYDDSSIFIEGVKKFDPMS